ncbi:10-deacetylbaccatin III 10-O-acetyltransferase-like [Panicum miliaceum]|uniref:10-deacetylbaccatin III 10-O-acetyltransferase-like n=1 Tax=Panicum miliaceum TaxID=4540 RepID=A0A3L6SP53_PANMI|nr:10-deacetylbaccatin III 10-O-acetyltransferase-like [Panicum miliaceum]
MAGACGAAVGVGRRGGGWWRGGDRQRVERWAAGDAVVGGQRGSRRSRTHAVRRTSRSYVRPSATTPSGALGLSIIDRVVGLRHRVRSLHVFAAPAPGPGAGRQDAGSPARAVREALGLGKALVDYYPFAGRFVDGAGGPASARVECAAWTTPAASTSTRSPSRRTTCCRLPDAAPDVEPLDLPLSMQVQVTEFSCGGFVVGLICCHAMADGLGAAQFINAVGNYARGLPSTTGFPTYAVCQWHTR